MAHRQDTGRMMRPSPLVVALALLIVMVVIGIGVVRSLAVSGADVPQVDIPVPVVNPPEATNTPIPKPTETSTPEPTITPTATPTPRVWTREQYEEFMNPRGPGGGYSLLQSGWYLYDGEELLGDYPCLTYCTSDEDFEEALRLMQEAFEVNNDADFWCEWACQGVYNGFGFPGISRVDEYLMFKHRYKDENVEPYCPQFVSAWYERFSCNTPQPRRTPIPRESLGWSEGVRTTIENKYLYPILYNNWDRWPGIAPGGLDEFADWDMPYEGWTREDVSALPDTYVCWIIANGHYHHGWPEQDIPTTAKYRSEYARFHELRLGVREWLNSELGTSVNGNPPLCPGFLDMIEPPHLP